MSDLTVTIEYRGAKSGLNVQQRLVAKLQGNPQQVVDGLRDDLAHDLRFHLAKKRIGAGFTQVCQEVESSTTIL